MPWTTGRGAAWCATYRAYTKQQSELLLRITWGGSGVPHSRALRRREMRARDPRSCARRGALDDIRAPRAEAIPSRSLEACVRLHPRCRRPAMLVRALAHCTRPTKDATTAAAVSLGSARHARESSPTNRRSIGRPTLPLSRVRASRAYRFGRPVHLKGAIDISRSHRRRTCTRASGGRSCSRDTVAYPTFRWSLHTARPIPDYPDVLAHVGHHLLRRRLELGLQQKEAAKILGTGAWNLRNWETGRHGIQNWYYPKVIRFLGYNPLPAATTRGQEVRRERLSRGWSRRRLGREAGVDEATVRRIEADTPRVALKPLQGVLRTLGIDRAELATPRTCPRSSASG